MIRHLAAISAATLLLACAAPEKEKTSAISSSGRYGSATELRKAAVELGYKCPKWKELKGGVDQSGVAMSSSSGTCGEDLFLVYSGKWSLQDQIDNWSLGSDVREVHLHTLTGRNWVLLMDQRDPSKLAKGLDAKVASR